MKNVAVIDVGSNSIKALVATRDKRGVLVSKFDGFQETRISQGISGHPPALRPDRIEAGVSAIQQLWASCQEHGPIDELKIVATSAVRGATNGKLFVEAVRKVTGQSVEVLTGDEEAEGIALGLIEDPQIKGHWPTYTCFDLGGGSLELIRFQENQLEGRVSLPLGAVRLTEAFISHSESPMTSSEKAEIELEIATQLKTLPFPLTCPVVGTGGGITVLRAILAHEAETTFDGYGPVLPARDIINITNRIISLPLTDRLTIPGLPTRRADIFPAALLVFQVLLQKSQATEIYSSRYNLRYGLASQLLAS